MEGTNRKKIREKALDRYIRQKHTQEECSGFIKGWEQCESSYQGTVGRLNAQLFKLENELEDAGKATIKLGYLVVGAAWAAFMIEMMLG